MARGPSSRGITMAVAMDLDKNAAIESVLAASTTLLGLLVVFQGFLISAYSGIPKTAQPEVRTPYRISIAAVLVVMLGCAAIAAAASLWLVDIHLYDLVTWGFTAVLAAAAATACVVTYLMIR